MRILIQKSEHGILILIYHGKMIGFPCLEVFLCQGYILLFCSDEAVYI